MTDKTIAEMLIQAYHAIKAIRDPYQKTRLGNTWSWLTNQKCQKDYRHTGKTLTYLHLFVDGSCLEYDQLNKSIRIAEWKN